MCGVWGSGEALATADEGDQLEFVVVLERGARVLGLGDDVAIALDRDGAVAKAQLLDELPDRRTFPYLSGLSIDLNAEHDPGPHVPHGLDGLAGGTGLCSSRVVEGITELTGMS